MSLAAMPCTVELLLNAGWFNARAAAFMLDTTVNLPFFSGAEPSALSAMIRAVFAPAWSTSTTEPCSFSMPGAP